MIFRCPVLLSKKPAVAGLHVAVRRHRFLGLGVVLEVADEHAGRLELHLAIVIDLEKRARMGDVQVGVEPEGMALSPDGRFLIQYVRDDQHAHFIDTETRRSWRMPGRFAARVSAEFKGDGSELWFLPNRRHHLRHRSGQHVVPREDHLEFPGCGRKPYQPVGISMTADGKTAFIALGPANRVAVVDAASIKSLNICWSGNGVWHLAFTPDENGFWSRMAFPTMFPSSMLPALKVIKTIQVGELPWGITIGKHEKPDISIAGDNAIGPNDQRIWTPQRWRSEWQP